MKKTSDFREKTTVAITSLDMRELLKIPNGHLPCPNCSKPWFFADNRGDYIDFSCRNCSFEFFADIEFLKFEPVLPEETLKCPKCQKNQFAIQIAQPFLCIGCRSCEHQWTADLQRTISGIHLLN